jgi:hypothetical protein
LRDRISFVLGGVNVAAAGESAADPGGRVPGGRVGAAREDVGGAVKMSVEPSNNGGAAGM